ncbi:GntR family transcriptional regulator [Lactiplantibacillus mudanjiangensis]|uniref:GntR family transcriptional regulator [Lactobacillus pentosus] n=1 Tax=Lactiplantibacillus mudanjiangensis TaxID=1296538 RepID=A0A660E0J6_9LACO|nr:GntR family transcriptional regulator [Lactiplantibacillus mudanjiangensis]VDG18822.1 GntR family transcriptional regulator [Lactobacillus pentosus] [Lactiplantibacillus mudanjiangensis]VDG25089.1 GntR family transcriptional regulator [Lactobacillus pentosus] [Lactiplantibacillus mudanjiangensis]VDG29006.1 GntR family transcriptional regulator [Lactobacillus pentosus] [Lactiplantibacillus mudanjiangensis]VDG32920.1 GntR family transcriptional regulator [Lactobacillus pentosus] [Lactiplantiba
MYRDIATSIVKAIRDGIFVTKLPTEAQLMERYSVSRNTIRKAIDLVYQQGLLRRVQGSGYFISKIQLRQKTVVNLSARSIMGGENQPHNLKSKVVTFDTIKADEQLGQQFGIPVDEELYRVIRLRYWHDQLYSLERSYYLCSVVRFISVEAVNSSIFEYLEEVYGIRVANSDDYLSLTELNPEDANLLAQPAGKAFLTLDSSNYYKNNGLFNFSHTVFAYPELALYFHTTNLANN